ncbi:electron transfer flavoprotein subunit alpha/FixB family protein [Phycicoccus endophyticus]|uniref:Electron transfer flavoprotein subunit alpha/FixB family protein n=1 Tax=Phycicoccus endophyticus TaxID=1690220 RepID=A0A7G9QYW0_9MICO|nr:electron transfer flavoprotein subunit alpha/FixB family protein [Phycicoccus endophyticus]QNN48535.1 electron transfer flavoprotein subunit alpha/FixB family protein [Phycicoccus endophyticus]GGL31061.1 electron transfer flavoprotein subunit alpha [Phycicoccus endophyticus]
MSVLVVLEVEDGRASLVSREALTFARDLGAGELHAVLVGAASEGLLADCRAAGVALVHEATDPALVRYAAAAWAAVVEAAGRAARADLVIAPGTGRGNEVLAHVAARRTLRMAANVVAVESLSPLVVQRQVVGGAALERASVPSRVRLLTMAGHAVEPVPAETPGEARVLPLEVALDSADLRAQVVRVEQRESADTSGLTGARVVVGAGRGAGGPDGFTAVDALAARLGGAVGVSRVVTSLGWRPHHEQVGQTGSRIAPDLYLACGISGSIQHWAGCASSRTIIAVNTDPDAPMVTKADYAVVGDMHEVLPALLEELG